jgi:hypothetical protein
MRKRTICSTLSSDPPSQYCIVRNQARRSCALPGMKRRIFGRRRSIFICFSPDWAEGSFEPRSFFRSFMGPEAGFIMSRSPIFVSETTSFAEMTPIIASQRSRRAFSSGRIAWMCSSMNKRFATTMSPCRTAIRASSSAAGFSAHSAAAWTETFRPGNSPDSRSETRAAGPAAWASSVTITIR